VTRRRDNEDEDRGQRSAVSGRETRSKERGAKSEEPGAGSGERFGIARRGARKKKLEVRSYERGAVCGIADLR